MKIKENKNQNKSNSKEINWKIKIKKDSKQKI
jgi:hypothetical protein